MLGPGDLGFPGLILAVVAFLFGGPIASFVIQWRWKKAVARKEEILRLVAMASEEAERAEVEAAVEFGTVVGGSRLFQCAVCYCPTTTRCSRCKAVRYCSGKCQIIHWRQGHKEECNPPSATNQFNGEQFEFCGNHLEGSNKWLSKPIETFTEECVSAKSSLPCGFSVGKEGDNEAVVGGKEGNTVSEFPSTLLFPGFSASSATHEASVDVSPIPAIPKSSKGFLSDDNASHLFVTTTDINCSKSPSPGLVTSVNSLSVPRKSKQKTSSCSADVIDHGSNSSSASNIKYCNEYSEPSTCFDFLEGMNVSGHDVHDSASKISGGTLFDSECLPSDGIARSGKAATNASTVQILPAKSSERLVTADNGQNDDASADHLYSSAKGCSAFSVKHSMADSVRIKATVSPDSASFLPNASNGLKMSVWKVAQQLKVPKLSKHRSFGVRSEVIFPFEMFIKLYNWEKVELRPCGLMNCGNSCYANAVLQCLAFTQPLTAYLVEGLHSRACPKKEWCFTCEFEYLVLKAREGKSPVSPIGILSRIKSIGSHLGHGKEEDAHEFLRYAVDSMQSVCLKEAGVNALSPLAEETTLVGLTFGGYLRSKIQCMKCLVKSEQHERMMDLTVEIQGDIGTLEDALAQFTATEILDGENKYQCNRCNSYEKAKKKLTILEAPNVLTIAFKRFQSGKFGKLNKSVRFPETLNLAPYMSGKGDKSPMYRLYAVVVHLDIMNAAFSGHYVCYVKNIQGKWFKTDDGRVKPVELDRVLSKGAYMLLYARCSPRAPSLMRNEMIPNGSKTKQDRSSVDLESPSFCRKGTIPRRRSTSTIPRPGLSTAHKSTEDSPYCMNLDGRLSFEYLDSFKRPFQQMSRISLVDSSSDSSSLFSCSDEGSCSTDSTRDSTSTEDFSDYIFGESGFGCNSSWRVNEDSDDPLMFSRRSPLGLMNRHVVGPPETNGHPSFSAEEVLNGDRSSRRLHQENSSEGLLKKGSPHFLYSDTIRNCRKLTNCGSSSSIRETNTDSDRLGRVNPLNVKSSVSLRRSTLGRTAQIQY